MICSWSNRSSRKFFPPKLKIPIGFLLAVLFKILLLLFKFFLFGSWSYDFLASNILKKIILNETVLNQMLLFLLFFLVFLLFVLFSVVLVCIFLI